MTSWQNAQGLNVGARRAGKATAMQGRARDQDMRGHVKYSCSECQIFYYMQEGQKARCPLCEEKRATQQVRDALFKITNQTHELQNENERLKVQVDTLTAMKTSLDLISQEDLTFVKQVVYRWQADRGRVAIKPTHGVPSGRGKRRSSKVDGFVAIFRDADAEVHQCNSVGGLALAGYLEEAVALGGPVKAMETLARAVLQHLKGSVEA